MLSMAEKETEGPSGLVDIYRFSSASKIQERDNICKQIIG